MTDDDLRRLQFETLTTDVLMLRVQTKAASHKEANS